MHTSQEPTISELDTIIAEDEEAMKQAKSAWKALPGTTLRRLRSTPSYFFLIWRWSAWLFAFVWIVVGGPYWTVMGHVLYLAPLAAILLSFTFLHTLLLTLYAPVFQFFLPRLPGRNRLQQLSQSKKRLPWPSRRAKTPAADEETDIFTPLIRTRSSWDVFIYGADVVICGLVTYFSGYFGQPYFGVGSPFYRYGMSAALAAALTYRYRGGLVAGFGYVLIILVGAFFPPPGIPHFVPKIIDIESAIIDTPLFAILAAYLATMLASYARSKREVQDDARRQKALRRVSDTIVREANDKQLLLQRSAEQIRQGGHFHRLIVALVRMPSDDDDTISANATAEIATCVEADLADFALPEKRENLPEKVLFSGKKLVTFDSLQTENNRGYGIARLYLPFFKDGKDGQVCMIIGAESRRQTPFDNKQEDFLTIAGAQLLVALENIRLTEKTIQLAAAAERGRIAREIHDGVAQLVYMLSLNAETCAAQASRIAEASEEDTELLNPLAERLNRLVTLSKQALWETRNYMFNLKPLMSGSTNLAQMLANQLREFEAISGLSTSLDVEGSEEQPLVSAPIAKPPAQSSMVSEENHPPRVLRYNQVGPALFRIVQEALTNAYKHAEATLIQVHLRHLQDAIEVEICDNGHGLKPQSYGYTLSDEGERKRIYSGHGLRGMRERAEELNGTLLIDSIPGGGVQIQVWIPI